MSAQNLSVKKVRRIARETEQDVIAGWSHGGYVLAFVTADHRHGWFHTTTSEWGWSDEPVQHYTSCALRWPEPSQSDDGMR